MKLIFKIIILSFMTYAYFFFNLGNTLLRMDNTGTLKFNISSLFTERFIGPIRTGYLLLNNSIDSFIPFVSFEFFRLSNPYSAFIFVFYIYNIIKQNF